MRNPFVMLVAGLVIGLIIAAGAFIGGNRELPQVAGGEARGGRPEARSALPPPFESTRCST